MIALLGFNPSPFTVHLSPVTLTQFPHFVFLPRTTASSSLSLSACLPTYLSTCTSRTQPTHPRMHTHVLRRGRVTATMYSLPPPQKSAPATRSRIIASSRPPSLRSPFSLRLPARAPCFITTHTPFAYALFASLPLLVPRCLLATCHAGCIRSPHHRSGPCSKPTGRAWLCLVLQVLLRTGFGFVRRGPSASLL